MGLICSEYEWRVENSQYANWYLETYPFLKTDNKNFPLLLSELKNFYLSDMSERNLTPLDSEIGRAHV